MDPGKYLKVQWPERFIRPEFADSLRAKTMVDSMPSNDVDALVKYNELTIYQCKQRVYAAHPAPRLGKDANIRQC